MYFVLCTKFLLIYNSINSCRSHWLNAGIDKPYYEVVTFTFISRHAILLLEKNTLNHTCYRKDYVTERKRESWRGQKILMTISLQ